MESMSDAGHAESSTPVSLLEPGGRRKYSYEPLPDAARFIRLIQIKPAADDDLIDCTLSEQAISDAPEYHAVSYTWGDPHELATITVNGKSMTVRQNCEEVLKQARHNARGKHVWVDAICINQADVSEKSLQVAIMGNIFGNACHVLACVGAHADDSEYVMQTLSDIRPSDYLGSSMSRWPGYRFFAKAMKWVFNRDVADLLRISTALKDLLERPYFERVWIIQEVFKKQKRASLCCGLECQPLGSLFVLRYILSLAQSDEFLQSKHWNRMPLPYLWRTLLDTLSGGKLVAISGQWRDAEYSGGTAGFLLASSFSGARKESMFGNKTGANSTSDLREVFALTYEFHCQDARDTIYAIIPLVDWNASTPISPDYRKARFVLVFEVLQRWQGASAVDFHDVGGVATRLGVEFGDENLTIAMALRRQKAARNKNARQHLQVANIPANTTTDERSLLLSGWDGVPLFDQRYGYHVRLTLISGSDEYLRREEANPEKLCEYNIRIEGIKQSRGREPLNIEVNLITPEKVQIGDWLMHLRYYSPVLIARPTPGKRFAIVSPGYLVQPQQDSRRAGLHTIWRNPRPEFPILPRIGFDVLLDIEYALIFALMCDELYMKQVNFGNPRLGERLSIPVSTREGDAFAKRK